MSTPYTLEHIKHKADKFLKCFSVSELVNLLKTTTIKLTKHLLFPEYLYFTIPKSNGEMREIEAPGYKLKKIQRNLNEYLQCVYYLNQTGAFFNHFGTVQARMYSPYFTNTAQLRKKQLLFYNTPEATNWIIDLLHDKISKRIKTGNKIRRLKDIIYGYSNELGNIIMNYPFDNTQ